MRLATLQAAGLIDVPSALRLLRVTARNQFHLFDERERDRGSVIYPQASMINHSCVPNCTMTARRSKYSHSKHSHTKYTHSKYIHSKDGPTAR